LQTKISNLVFAIGLAGPLLALVMDRLAVGRAGPSPGGATISILSFTCCLFGALIRSATVRQKLAMLLLAMVIIPFEILLLGVILLLTGGLTGTQ